MTFPVLIEPADGGGYLAKLLGEGGQFATGATQQEAVEALTTSIEQRLARGEMTVIELPRRGILGLAGKYADDPSLTQICDEAYADRDQAIEA